MGLKGEKKKGDILNSMRPKKLFNGQLFLDRAELIVRNYH